MFAYIEGTIEEITVDSVVLDHEGIGYQIFLPVSDLERLVRGTHNVRIHTHFQVSETGVALFGFLSREEKEMFLLLLSVNGVGPKAALSVMGSLTLDELRFAILSEDSKTISKAPGIGPKSAKRIILDLKDKIDMEEAVGIRLDAGAAEIGNAGVKNDTIAALVALGYSGTEALRAYNEIENADALDTDAALKECLKKMALF